MTDGVLDELRKEFAEFEWGPYNPFAVINRFEAAHHGLVDLTGWAVERYEETDPDGNRYQAIHSTRLTERTP